MEDQACRIRAICVLSDLATLMAFLGFHPVSWIDILVSSITAMGLSNLVAPTLPWPSLFAVNLHKEDETIMYRSKIMVYEDPTEVANFLDTYLISHRQNGISLHVHLGLQQFECV